MKNSFWFGIALAASILAVIWSFKCADILRGYDALGGEIFTVSLPLWIAWKREKAIAEQVKRFKRINRELMKRI